jgi:DNA-binding NarL/FixJ family response regulator
MKALIAEAHAMVRCGLRNLLSETHDFALVDEACCGAEVLTKIGRVDYDLILLDLSLPGSNILDLLKRLQQEKPALRVLVMGDYPEGRFVGRILETGASGYLAKKSVADELDSAVRTVMAGRQYVHAPVEEGTAPSAREGASTASVGNNLRP